MEPIQSDEEVILRFRNCFAKKSREKYDPDSICDSLLGKTKFLERHQFPNALHKSKFYEGDFAPKEIEQIFDVIQRKGKVDKFDLNEALRISLSPYKMAIVDYVFKRLDQNQSGYIEFQELTQFYNGSLLPVILNETPTALSLQYVSKVQSVSTRKRPSKKVEEDDNNSLYQADGVTEGLDILASHLNTGSCLFFLVVDDSMTILKTTSMVLTKAGHRVDTAINGKLALELMSCKIYDVVLMDIQMPLMDGVEAVTIFRRMEASLNRKEKQFIIGISASNDQKTRISALECGMDAFLKKPFAKSTVLKLIAQRDSKLSPTQLYDYYTDLCITHGRNDEFARVVLDEFLLKADDAQEFLKLTLQNSPELRHYMSDSTLESGHSNISGGVSGSGGGSGGERVVDSIVLASNRPTPTGKMSTSGALISPTQPSVPKSSIPSPTHKLSTVSYANQPLDESLSASQMHMNDVKRVNGGGSLSTDQTTIIQTLRRTIEEQSRVIASQQTMIQSQQQMITSLMALSQNGNNNSNIENRPRN